MFVGVGAAPRARPLRAGRARRLASSSSTSSTRRPRPRRLPRCLGGHDEKEQTLNQLLVEMDGFDTSSGLIIPRRHQPAGDPRHRACARALDRQVLVDRPDRKGWLEILTVHSAQGEAGTDAKLDEWLA